MSKSSRTDLFVVTLATRNRLAEACCAIGSFMRHHPGSRPILLVVDAVREVGLHSPFSAEVLNVADLALPDEKRLLFKYRAFELCCALKVFLLRHVLARQDAGRVVYLDADTLTLNPLEDVLEAGWRDHDVLLAPHLLDPWTASNVRSQTETLRHGVFNAGLVALRRGDAATRFLDWWSCAARDMCLEDPERGIYVDQKWLDAAQACGMDIGVLRDPGLNVGYWNLDERRLRSDGQRGWLCRDVPLRLFHFSDFDPARLTLKRDVDVSSALPLAREYDGLLCQERAAFPADAPYGWDRYANGESIAPAERDVILRGDEAFAGVDDPFALPSAGPLWETFKAVAAAARPARFRDELAMHEEWAASCERRLQETTACINASPAARILRCIRRLRRTSGAQRQ